MRAGRRSLVGGVGALALAAGFLGAAPPAWAAEPTTPFISEIHYDNAGTDTGEFVEVQVPAHTSTIGWRIELYNGETNPTSPRYDDDALPGGRGEGGRAVLSQQRDPERRAGRHRPDRRRRQRRGVHLL
jgi:5'-nucleotidase